MRLRFGLPPTALAAMLLAWPAGLAATAQEPASSASWVAADAAAFAEITRPADLIDRLTAPDVEELLEAVPGLNEALENKQFRDLMNVAELIAAQLDTTVEAGFRDLTAGGIALAIEGKDKVERVYLIVTPKDSGLLVKAHEAVLRLARADARDNGRPEPVTEGDHGGIKTYSVSPEEAHAILDDRLVIANGPGPLAALIDRAGGDPPAGFAAMADDPDCKAARDAVGADALAFAFGRLDRLRAFDPDTYKVDEPEQGGLFLLGSWYESLLKSEWIALGLSWTGEELAARLTIPAPEGGFSDAMARFRPEPGAGALPPTSPPNTILTASLRRDFAAIWEVRDQIFRGETLQGLAQLDGVAGQFFGGRDFGTGVLGSLGTSQRFVIANQDYEQLKPSPDLKLPGFALLVGLNPNDTEFAIRLKSAFQSFVGIINLDPNQKNAAPLMLGAETVDGVTLSTSRYLAPAEVASKPDPGPIDTRYNFSPTAAEVDSTFVLGSATEVVKDLIPALKSEDDDETGPTPYTLVVEANGEEAAKLVEVNRERLAMRNMLEKGSSRETALQRIDLLSRLARYLGHGKLTIEDRADATELVLRFRLGSAASPE